MGFRVTVAKVVAVPQFLMEFYCVSHSVRTYALRIRGVTLGEVHLDASQHLVSCAEA